MTRFLVAVLLLGCVAVALPAPDVLYYVSPRPNDKNLLTTSCPPTVVGPNGAFVCYTYNGEEYVQSVIPSNPTYQTITSPLPYTNTFIDPPIALSNLTAIAYARSAESSFYVLFSYLSTIHTVNRRGSTARVAYAPDLQIAYVPIGVAPRLGWYESIVAFDITAATEQERLLFNVEFNGAPGVNVTQMSDPIYYRGYVYVATQKQLCRMNATSGYTNCFTDPCQFNTNQPFMYLALVTIGTDFDGSTLDAFILIANTSTADYVQTSFCRVSHNTMQQKWRQDYPDDLAIDDITGGLDLVVLSGRNLGLSTYLQYVTWSIGATSGQHVGVINRSPQDRNSFPTVLPQPVGGCQQTIVLQVDGNLTAYCHLAFETPIWISSFPCTYRPVTYEASNLIACTNWGQSVHLIDSDGFGIWINDQITAHYTPVIVGNVVYVVDSQSSLWGLTITPSATPLPPPYVPSGNGGGGSSGLSSGETALIVVIFVFAGIVAGILGATYLKRRRARGARLPTEETVQEKSGYGTGLAVNEA